MLDLLNPTKSQRIVAQELLFGKKRGVAWLGATGSGKTAGLAQDITLLSIRDRDYGYGSGMNILMGQTVGQLKRNIGGYLKDVCKQLGVPFAKGNDDGAYYSLAGQQWKLFAGGKDGDAARVQGFDATSFWADEVSLIREDAFQAATLRMRYPQGKLLMSTNAGSPFHWVKSTFFEKTPEWCLSVETPYDENQHYAQEQRDWILGSFISGHIRARMLDNVWAPAGGAIYPIDLTHVVEEPFEPVGRVFLDAGTAGVTAALLYVPRGDGWLVVDEYYHDANKEGQLTDGQHIEAIVRKGWQPLSWDVDPAAASFKAEVRKHGLPVRNALNDVLEGIQSGLNALFSGQVRINRWRCPQLLRELAGLIWNPMTDKPQEGLPDHAADAFRYGNRRLFPPSAGVVFGRA